jgi:hypothetical protein
MPNIALIPDKKTFRRFNHSKNENTGKCVCAVARRLSADPAMGDYLPSAPVNDEARRRNGNLPGMGGVFNYVNLHTYHYAGNNPVRYTDPDGRYSGLKKIANEFKNVLLKAMETLRVKSDYSIESALDLVTKPDINNSKTKIPIDSRRPAITDLGMKTTEEVHEYSRKEIVRYEAFAEIRGQDGFSYHVASEILDAAEFRYKRAESEALFNGESKINAKRYAENEANKIIDDFICRYNQEYIPPEPIPTE